MEYVTVKWLHILAATFLFGTGIGSAFYLLLITLGRDPRAVAAVARVVVIADWLFTATTVVAQPLTGFWLVHLAGFPLGAAWLTWSIVLYVVAVACWIPVVRIQMRLRDLAQGAVRDGTPLPAAYWHEFRMWVALGIPAFFAFVAVFYLMVAKPAELG
ncbi:DUF2269 domain-containing protein [Parapusillimonas sp. SGNA-6]|jgi:uncharacterized membrane protein|nr:DUF2269 domain-containing protein [Parapusillimonas sp. SGNA-6]